MICQGWRQNLDISLILQVIEVSPNFCKINGYLGLHISFSTAKLVDNPKMILPCFLNIHVQYGRRLMLLYTYRELNICIISHLFQNKVQTSLLLINRRIFLNIKLQLLIFRIKFRYYFSSFWKQNTKFSFIPSLSNFTKPLTCQKKNIYQVIGWI